MDEPEYGFEPGRRESSLNRLRVVDLSTQYNVKVLSSRDLSMFTSQ